MTEVSAVVLAAREKLVADDQAKVLALRVSASTKLLLHSAANLLALVLVASLHCVAHSLAPEVVELVNLFLRKELVPLVRWIVDLIAR